MGGSANRVDATFRSTSDSFQTGLIGSVVHPQWPNRTRSGIANVDPTLYVFKPGPIMWIPPLPHMCWCALTPTPVEPCQAVRCWTRTASLRNVKNQQPLWFWCKGAFFWYMWHTWSRQTYDTVDSLCAVESTLRIGPIRWKRGKSWIKLHREKWFSKTAVASCFNKPSIYG